MAVHATRMPEPDQGSDLAMLVDSFLNGYTAERTIEAYRQDLDQFFRWCDARRLDPLAAQRRDCELYARHLQSRAYAPRSLSRRIGTVHMFFRRLVEDGLASEDPTVRIRRPRIERMSTTNGLTRTEVADMVRAAEKSGVTMEYALICLLALNGYRVAEACSLSIEHLGTDHGSTTVRVKVKGGRWVTDKLPNLTSWVIHQAIDGRTEGPVLLNRYGNRMTTENARRCVARLAKQCGIRKRITPHSFRHALVTNLLDADVSERDIMIATHHLDPRMIVFYDRGRNNLLRHPSDRMASHILGVL